MFLDQDAGIQTRLAKALFSLRSETHLQIPFTDIFCVGYMLSELVAREEDTQLAGLVSITDASGFGIKHVSVMCVRMSVP